MKKIIVGLIVIVILLLANVGLNSAQAKGNPGRGGCCNQGISCPPTVPQCY